MSVCMCARFNEVSDTDHFVLHTQHCVLLLFCFSSAFLHLLPVFFFLSFLFFIFLPGVNVKQMWHYWLKNPNFSYAPVEQLCCHGDGEQCKLSLMSYAASTQSDKSGFCVCYQRARLQHSINMQPSGTCCSEAQLFLRAPQWEIEWGLAGFSTMWHKLRWWAPENCRSLILISSGQL